MRKIVLFVFTAIVIGACTSVDCPVQNSVYTVYGLLKANGTTDTLTVDTLSVITRRSNQTLDTLLDKLTGKSTFDIPISYTQPEDTLFFALRDTLGNTYRDTVFLKKDNYPHFESVDCQASYFHRLTDVRSTHHIIDSIVINNPTVNYEATTEHFFLYLKTRY